jgi:hypothetical protein
VCVVVCCVLYINYFIVYYCIVLFVLYYAVLFVMREGDKRIASDRKLKVIRNMLDREVVKRRQRRMLDIGYNIM